VSYRQKMIITSVLIIALLQQMPFAQQPAELREWLELRGDTQPSLVSIPFQCG
jgi:hypothetical protein